MSRRRRRTRGRPPLAFKVAASTLVLVLFGVGAELTARTLDLDGPRWRSDARNSVIMVGHPTRLWGMAAGVRDNAGAIATIHEQGLRAPIPNAPRPDGVERVMVLGDSTFFGHGVGDDETLPARLEAELVERGIQAEVINGAVPGYSTEQTLLLLEEQGWSYEPTLLVLGNLWSDNNVDGFRDIDLLKTAAVYRDTGLGRSAFYRLLVAQLDRVRGGDGARMITWTTTSEWPEEGKRRVPLVQYAANLDRIAQEARERGAGVAFIAPANDGLVSGRFRGTAGWDPYFDAQRQLAAHHGAPLIDGLAALQAELDREPGALFLDEMHPNARGHRALGAAVAQGLVAAGWPADPLLASPEPFDAGALTEVGLEMGAKNGANRSPQAQLFASTAPEVGAPMPDPKAYPTGEAGAWPLAGAVEGGSGPIHVRVVTEQGVTLGFTDLPGPGPFELTLPAEQASVTVIASGPEGGDAQATVRRGDPPTTLTLP